MPCESSRIFRDCPETTRIVHVGGLTAAELSQALASADIALNEYAQILLASDLLTTSPEPYSLKTIQVTVGRLGFPQGATISEIHQRACERGLCLCPLELGPHLRLQYRDQAD